MKNNEKSLIKIISANDCVVRTIKTQYICFFLFLSISFFFFLAHPCQYPPEPVNGRRHCYETAEGVYCNVSCNEGFAFAIPPAEIYFCAYDSVWTPEDKMPYSDCSG